MASTADSPFDQRQDTFQPASFKIALHSHPCEAEKNISRCSLQAELGTLRGVVRAIQSACNDMAYHQCVCDGSSNSCPSYTAYVREKRKAEQLVEDNLFLSKQCKALLEAVLATQEALRTSAA